MVKITKNKKIVSKFAKIINVIPFSSKLGFLFFTIILIGCESLNGSVVAHPVVTVDRAQVNSLNCVYLYNTEKKESGWNNSSATANAIRVLKDQALIAGGNAIVIRDIYSSEERNYSREGYGYEVDAAGIYVDVYNCPFKNESAPIE